MHAATLRPPWLGCPPSLGPPLRLSHLPRRSLAGLPLPGTCSGCRWICRARSCGACRSWWTCLSWTSRPCTSGPRCSPPPRCTSHCPSSTTRASHSSRCGRACGSSSPYSAVDRPAVAAAVVSRATGPRRRARRGVGGHHRAVCSRAWTTCRSSARAWARGPSACCPCTTHAHGAATSCSTNSSSCWAAAAPRPWQAADTTTNISMAAGAGRHRRRDTRRGTRRYDLPT